MIDKVGAIILKDKKYWYKEKRIIEKSVLFQVEKEKITKQFLKH